MKILKASIESVGIGESKNLEEVIEKLSLRFFTGRNCPGNVLKFSFEILRE